MTQDDQGQYDDGYGGDPRQGYGSGRQNYQGGYRWNPQRGILANVVGLGLSTVPSFFGAIGDLASELKGVKSGLKKFDDTKRELKEGVSKHTKRLEELAEAGVELKDNPDARVAHFGNYFELGLRPTADARGRPATFGFIVLNNGSQYGVYAYNHPGFFMDADYFKTPKPRTADNPKVRSTSSDPLDSDSSSGKGGKLANLLKKANRAYAAARVVTEKVVDAAKLTHEEVRDVDSYMGDPKKMQEKLDKRVRDIHERGGRIRDWTDHCIVKQFGPFVELEVPLPDDGTLGSVANMRDTYMINLITGEVRSKYPHVKRI